MGKQREYSRWHVRQINGRWLAIDPVTGNELEASSEGELLAMIDSLEVARSIPTLEGIGARIKKRFGADDDSEGGGVRINLTKRYK